MGRPKGKAASVCPQTPPSVESGAAIPGMYMQVETRTSSRLHLKRAPGIRSWSLLVGILSIGLAAAYYSGDTLGWKLFYVTGCLFVAVQNLEDWEEAVFDKSTGKVVLKTFSLYKKLLTLFKAGHDQVVVLLQDVRDVSVEEEKVRYFGKGYMVVLRLATGFSHPLTQSAVMGHRREWDQARKCWVQFGSPRGSWRLVAEGEAGVGYRGALCRGALTFLLLLASSSDVEAVAKLITSFLELHCLESPTEMSQSSDSEAGDPGSQS
ncbi:Cytochrome b-245 chaperone 1 [Plecturocebus cupreus]